MTDKGLVIAALSMICIAAGPASAQSHDHRVEQLSAPDASPILVQPPAPIEARLPQLHPPAERAIAPAPRPIPGARSPLNQLQSGDRTVQVAAPPPGAVDRCEAHHAGLGPAPEGLDCAMVLEAAAFLNRSPERQLLGPSEEDVVAVQRPRPSNPRLPDAEDVAQRLAAGSVAGSSVAQAIASGYRSSPPAEPEPATTPSPTLPGVPTLPPSGGN